MFQQSKGLSPAQISSLVTIMYLAQMIIEIPSGAFADLLGRRTSMIISFILGAFAYIVYPLFQNYWQALAIVLLIGVSDSFRSGSEEALIYDSFKQDKREEQISKVYTNGNFIYQIGLILGAALSGFLFATNQLFPFWGYAVSMAFGAIAVCFYIEPFIDSEKFSWGNYLKQMKQGVKEIFKTELTSTFSTFYIFVGGIAWSSTLYFNEYMMVSLGFSDQLRGILSAGMRLINVFLIGKLLTNEKLFDFKRTVVFFPLIMLLAYLPGAFLQGYWGIPFVQGAMIATTARWIVLAPLVNKAFDSKVRATALSVLSLLIGFVYVGMTTLSMYVIPTFGMPIMYSVLGIVTLFTAVPAGIKLLKLHS